MQEWNFMIKHLHYQHNNFHVNQIMKPLLWQLVIAALNLRHDNC